MKAVERSALVGHSAQRMFDLVRDVNAYPEFLSWCSGARVLSDDGAEQLATLEVSLAGVRQSFTTRNRLVEPEEIEMRLVQGPFRELAGSWRFKPIGEEGCRVSLGLRFEISNRLLAAAFERSFSRVADNLVDDFSERADAIHG